MIKLGFHYYFSKFLVSLLLGLFLVSLSACSLDSKKDGLGLTLIEPTPDHQRSDLLLVAPYPSHIKDFHLIRPDEVRAYLMDNNGVQLGSWLLPREALNVKLSPDGLLYAMLFTPWAEKQAPIRGECNEILALDRSGKIHFSYRQKLLTHDFAFVSEDRIATLNLEKLSEKELLRFSHELKEKVAFSDVIKVIDKNSGKSLWNWRVADNLSRIDYDKALVTETSLSHGNSLSYIAKQKLSSEAAFLVSFRSLNVVLLIEYPSGRILWQSPRGELARQHDATYKDGKVLVFDNNITSVNALMRAQMWDVVTNKSIWKWNDYFIMNTSPIMGGIRLLRNGNFLVSNSTAGQVFEITSEGKIVWNYLFRDGNSNSTWLLGRPFFRAETYDPLLLNIIK